MIRICILILVLVATGSKVAGAADSVPPSGRLSFGIFRNGEKIGSRTIDFKRDAAVLTVESTVTIAVKVFFVTAYRMFERKWEVWRDGGLIDYRADIDDNGTKSRVRARLSNGALMIEGPAGKIWAEPGAAPSTYWSETALRRARLFDSSTGERLDIQVAQLPSGAAGTRKNGPDPRRYRVTGGLDRVIWYDPDGVWMGLRMTARDGSVIEYRREAERRK